MYSLLHESLIVIETQYCRIIIISHELLIILQFSLTPDKIGFVFIANAISYATTSPVIGLLSDRIVSSNNPKHFCIAINSKLHKLN